MFRIDHYLGKETVQNILAFRFANGMFEPIWNRRYIDHVQITVAEKIGIEGRGAFYEQVGNIRDMISTHLFQVMTFVAMEPPVSFAPDRLRDETVKALRSTDIVEPGSRDPGPVRRATATSRASHPTRRPRPSRRWSSTSTTGDGRASRSSCAPARGWPRR